MTEARYLINKDQYQAMYAHSINDPEDFWHEQANIYLTWQEKWQKVLTGSFKTLDVRWFVGGKLNACYNCVDRHLPTRGDQPAIIWESDDPSRSETITYHDLYTRVCRFANVLKYYEVNKGDRVCIYMPMIPDAVVAMLACARIGAVHSVVFGGFSSESLKTRINDADCRIVITANEGMRGNKPVPLKNNVDQALKDCPNVRTVIVVKHTNNQVAWNDKHDVWYHDAAANQHADCPPVIMDANDPLFILYTSGSTGKPKGIVHGTGGYMVYAAMTHKLIFDYHDNDVYWCTADVGWITGHTYGVYGPLANGAISVIFEGVPNYPSPARFWEVIDKHKVNIFYTAPTAIRALRREGDQWVKQTSRQSLRILGSVGEPINPEAWEWYHRVVGEDRCPIVDTWWQTETGGIMISAFPGATELKPGSATQPFFGIVPEIVNDEGKAITDGKMGRLLIKQPWPGLLQTVYKNPERFAKGYFEEFPGNYLTGDQAYCDNDGYYWILGRSDDVLKVSGHRIGTQEVESAIITHQAVAEAAVVGKEDDIKGHSIYAFVTLKAGFTPSKELKKEIVETVRGSIGPIATPEHIQWAAGLPKTRSGKIMRRLLRKIAEDDVSDLGDLSTLADPGVIEILIKERKAE